MKEASMAEHRIPAHTILDIDLIGLEVLSAQQEPSPSTVLQRTVQRRDNSQPSSPLNNTTIKARSGSDKPRVIGVDHTPVVEDFAIPTCGDADDMRGVDVLALQWIDWFEYILPALLQGYSGSERHTANRRSLHRIYPFRSPFLVS
ncbi:uncharacterized protein ARMOST_21856 [Armillaria ostoyae]|uniref:Uncharacterized protein n=1 Tax=Armillaria ostoyae TaxID=47428 RepID=A0A284SB86_ARMOS|nr:uncharacterized protein ARMOST_21856 [Armillaria ostoyae]